MVQTIKKQTYRCRICYKIYTNRNGERTRQHRHPGIRGYHEPLTSHRVAKERHPKGQLDPEYEKDASGEWAYVR